MPQNLTWNNASDLGLLLSQTHPGLTPSSVSIGDLQGYVAALPGFKDDTANLTDAKLEAIRQAWHEEFQDRTQD